MAKRKVQPPFQSSGQIPMLQVRHKNHQVMLGNAQIDNIVEARSNKARANKAAVERPKDDDELDAVQLERPASPLAGVAQAEHSSQRLLKGQQEAFKGKTTTGFGMQDGRFKGSVATADKSAHGQRTSTAQAGPAGSRNSFGAGLADGGGMGAPGAKIETNTMGATTLYLNRQEGSEGQKSLLMHRSEQSLTK